MVSQHVKEPESDRNAALTTKKNTGKKSNRSYTSATKYGKEILLISDNHLTSIRRSSFNNSFKDTKETYSIIFLKIPNITSNYLVENRSVETGGAGGKGGGMQFN